MGLIDFNNPYFLYFFGGFVFNFIFDTLVLIMYDKVEGIKVRLTMLQRIIAMFVWPVYLAMMIFFFIYHITRQDD